jgi:purine-binding chemotaxis protein CheW
MADASLPATSAPELVLFAVGELLCGLDVRQVQEINRNIAIAPVRRAPPFVRGVVNLRGQLVTVIDLRRKLGLEPAALHPGMRIVVSKARRGLVGLLVDSVADIIPVEPTELEPPPANVKGVSGEFFGAVYKLDDRLAGVLDLGQVLKE